MKQQIRKLTTVRQIVAEIDKALGRGEFKRLIEREKQSIPNYKNSNRLPADTFLIVTAELAKLGCEAPPRLWGIKEPLRVSRAA